MFLTTTRTMFLTEGRSRLSSGAGEGELRRQGAAAMGRAADLGGDGERRRWGGERRLWGGRLTLAATGSEPVRAGGGGPQWGEKERGREGETM